MGWLKWNFIGRCLAVVLLSNILLLIWIYSQYGAAWPSYLFTAILFILDIPLVRTLIKLEKELYG